MLNEKAIVGLINASPEKRYKSFLNTVTDLEKVWFLHSPNGYATVDMNGYIHILIWPREEFCRWFMSKGEEPIFSEIHEFLEKCEELDESVRFMVFPTNKDSYIVTTNQLCLDIQEHLAEIE